MVDRAGGADGLGLCWRGEVREVRREREGLFGGERGFEGAGGDSEGGMVWIVEGGLERGEEVVGG